MKKIEFIIAVMILIGLLPVTACQMDDDRLDHAKANSRMYLSHLVL